MADGEATLHDRSLAILKVALVNLDRLHFDAAAGSLCDTATVAAAGTVSRTRRISAVEAGGPSSRCAPLIARCRRS